MIVKMIQVDRLYILVQWGEDSYPVQSSQRCFVTLHQAPSRRTKGSQRDSVSFVTKPVDIPRLSGQACMMTKSHPISGAVSEIKISILKRPLCRLLFVLLLFSTLVMAYDAFTTSKSLKAACYNRIRTLNKKRL